MSVRFTSRFLVRLACAIETHWIPYDIYAAWCDRHILAEPEPPHWMLELTATRDPVEAGGLVTSTAAEQADAAGALDRDDFWVACQFLRCQRDDIDWATFLTLAAGYSDCAGGTWECEEYYQFLNELEAIGGSGWLEAEQVRIFTVAFHGAIREAIELHRKLTDPPR